VGNTTKKTKNDAKNTTKSTTNSDSRNIAGKELRKSRRFEIVGEENARSSCVKVAEASERKDLKMSTFDTSDQLNAQSAAIGQSRKQQIYKRKRKTDNDLVYRKMTNAGIVKKDSSKGSSNQKNWSSSVKFVAERSKSPRPYAPMGHLWLSNSNSHGDNASVEDSLIGRRWVWDEGYFVDDHFDPQTRNGGRDPEPPLLHPNSAHLDFQSRNKGEELEASLRKYRCSCGSTHLSNMANFKSCTLRNDRKSYGRARRRESSASSYSASVTMQLASGKLDPHTLVSCEEYKLGPEFRFTVQPVLVQPFLVRINPDATFLADVHAHLCTSEIIGLLGGHYSNEEKCIYIQAAFPCKSTNRTDSGQTDVEMDPVGQMYATEAISNHGMSVVGWYHSHPDFQPNPSITDIENQASYQHLFKGDNLAKTQSENSVESVPFVGLIAGTYDGENPSSQSVMRWFHCRPKKTGKHKIVNYPMNLKTTNRHFRKIKFDNKRTENNIRRSMTLHGACIREVLESRYLCCPVSEVPKKIAGKYTQLSAASSKKYKENTQKKVTYPNCHSQPHPNENRQVSNKERLLSMIETDEAPLLLSESTFTLKPNIQSARPLYFTKNERSLLETKDDTVPEDIFAGIIWLAVEREQQMLSTSGKQEDTVLTAPASSRSILELLSDWFDDTDAIIVHNIDAVFGHYASKLNRINPFSSWNGAGDKGNVSIKMKKVLTDKGLVYHGGIKMKRGHKIAACLLKWARNMQLSHERMYEPHGNCLRFDHEQKLCNEINSHYIYFVSEVMRLMAARWRECSVSKRRGRPPK